MKRLAVTFFVISFIFASSIVHATVAGSGQMSVFDKVAKETVPKNGVKEITYDQFMEIRNSGEQYVLLDVFSPDSYAEGHIEGAVSFPRYTINKETALSRLSKDAKIIVYCGSFHCVASTDAAKTLIALRYNVLNYKGGLEDWQNKGNSLVK
jgi:rhodanese-related sulfurtransferase